MSAFAPHQPLHLIPKSPSPSYPSVHHSQSQSHRPSPSPSPSPPPPPPPPFSPRMDPLDLLSRVALGQYSLPTSHPPIQSQPTTTTTTTTPHPWLRPSPPPPPQQRQQKEQPPTTQFPPTPTPPPLHPTLEPSPSTQLHHHTRYHPINHTKPIHQNRFIPDLSPVSSDDSLPATCNPHARRPDLLITRVTKAMRTQTHSNMHHHHHHHHHHKTRTQPSRFCHICSRTSKKIGLVVCANFATGACRKVVCQKCFNDHQWNWEQALEMGSKWICTHCRHECPERAQCAIYKRTNERRREQQQQQRSLKAETALTSHSIKGAHSGLNGRAET